MGEWIKKSQAITTVSKEGHRERSINKVELPNTDLNIVVVLTGKFGALTQYRKDHLRAVKASWSHLKEHHLQHHLWAASPVLWTNLI